MAKVLDLSDIPIVPASMRYCRFFKLPLELRQHIYRYVLVEPDVLSKRHKALCSDSYDDRTTTTPEWHPFLQGYYGWEPKRTCECLRRKGLGLLRANSRIYAESSPIFWAKNTFCFMDEKEFSRYVGVCGQYVQHISIVGGIKSPSYHPLTGDSTSHGHSNLWELLHRCPELRTLELDVMRVVGLNGDYTQLDKCCRNLRAITLSHLRAYPVRPSTGDRGPVRCIYLKMTQPIPTKIICWADLDTAVKDFWQKTCVDFNAAFCEQVLNSNPGLVAHYSRPVLPIGLNDSINITLAIRDGSKYSFPLYSLPNSATNRRRHAKERRVNDSLRKAAGLLTLKETRATRHAEEKRLERSNVHEARLMEMEELSKQLKENGKAKREREAVEALAKQKADRRAHLQKQMHIAEGAKENERKRVQPRT